MILQFKVPDEHIPRVLLAFRSLTITEVEAALLTYVKARVLTAESQVVIKEAEAKINKEAW